MPHLFHVHNIKPLFLPVFRKWQRWSRPSSGDLTAKYLGGYGRHSEFASVDRYKLGNSSDHSTFTLRMRLDCFETISEYGPSGPRHLKQASAHISTNQGKPRPLHTTSLSSRLSLFPPAIRLPIRQASIAQTLTDVAGTQRRILALGLLPLVHPPRYN